MELLTGCEITYNISLNELDLCCARANLSERAFWLETLSEECPNTKIKYLLPLRGKEDYYPMQMIVFHGPDWLTMDCLRVPNWNEDPEDTGWFLAPEIIREIRVRKNHGTGRNFITLTGESK